MPGGGCLEELPCPLRKPHTGEMRGPPGLRGVCWPVPQRVLRVCWMVLRGTEGVVLHGAVSPLVSWLTLTLSGPCHWSVSLAAGMLLVLVAWGSSLPVSQTSSLSVPGCIYSP